MTDVAIIGSGVTGLSAAIYAGRYELSTTVFGAELGGATTTAWTVENYPGFEAIDGYDLVVKMKDQAEKVGAKVVNDKIIKVEKIDSGFRLATESGQTLESKTVVMAGGAARRKLNLPQEDYFAKGRGLHYCATCDGPLYRGKVVAIVGGGDAAIKGVNLTSLYAEKVYIIVRRDVFTAEPINLQQAQKFFKSGKAEVLFNTQVKELLGTERLEGVKFDNGKELKLDGLFIEIGAIPDVSLATALGVALDDKGYVKVSTMMETNIPGVYAAGDATDFFGEFKQIITGCAMGAVAATSAFKYIGK